MLSADRPEKTAFVVILENATKLAWHCLTLPLEMSGLGKLTRVLVALQHQLGNTSVRVPELHAAVLGAAEHPVTVRSKCDTKHEILHSWSVCLDLIILLNYIPCGLQRCGCTCRQGQHPG